MTTATAPSPLLEPFAIGGLELPDRIVMAPLTRGRHGWPLAPSADMADRYSPTGAKGSTDFPPHQR